MKTSKVMRLKNIAEKVKKTRDNLNRFNYGDLRIVEMLEEMEFLIERVQELERKCDKIARCASDYRLGHLLDIQDSFFVDEIIAIMESECHE